MFHVGGFLSSSIIAPSAIIDTQEMEEILHIKPHVHIDLLWKKAGLESRIYYIQVVYLSVCVSVGYL